ncbi:SDR family NAD(P)-dependent oxidoreductase [Occultella gossypii]|uniref:Glucose 1-dehydrogenase n=1 Tax=Occultella gossypii TaxID=2800820 RepID=A0ABS7SC36_9MICO|nr:glucose 1-dehydrogenase [Occultella gossypii]MBZ2197916.1 glucose 1-dehydrogenase [Occultella gossypii]
MANLLDGKVAIITGGASGIGQASVEAFVDHGAKVIIGDIQDELGESLAKKLGDSARYVHADVTNEDDVAGLVDAAVESYGKLDVMFNNAGAPSAPSPIVDVSTEYLDKALALFVRSVVLGHKYAARQFKKQATGGSIISTSSLAGLQGGWGDVGYSTAKAAVPSIARVATIELGKFGIRSNVIAPGIIVTPIFTRYAGLSEEDSGKFLERLEEKSKDEQPLGRTGVPNDIAGPAVFLASDLSSFISGVTIPVDGGSSSVTFNRFDAIFGEVAAEMEAGWVSARS